MRCLVWINENNFPAVASVFSDETDIVDEAARAVPRNTPYLVMDSSEIPLTNEEKLVWAETLDFTNADRWGILSNAT